MLEYKVLTSERHHEVILWCFNAANGETAWMKFDKLGTCVKFIERHSLPVRIGDVITREDFFNSAPIE